MSDLVIISQTLAGGAAAVNGTPFELSGLLRGEFAILHGATNDVDAVLQVQSDNIWHTHVDDIVHNTSRIIKLFPGTWRFRIDAADDGEDHTFQIRRAYA